ncbi:MAG: hypothetical protein JSS91_06535 [Bacteroidetes bacterium]|nr:hypothetical protein [Bacteroidota bacterium]
MDNFEEKLSSMSKPEVSELRHQEMISSALIKAKDRTALSFWWISIPLYLIAMLVMKTFYMPESAVTAGIRDFSQGNMFTAIVFFILAPAAVIIMNLLSIRKIYYVSGNPKPQKFLKTVIINLIMIILSVFVIIIFLI